MGPVRESNPGPRAPEARIIPLDQQAIAVKSITKGPKYGSENETMVFVEAWKLSYDAMTNWYRYHSCQNLDENINLVNCNSYQDSSKYQSKGSSIYYQTTMNQCFNNIHLMKFV